MMTRALIRMDRKLNSCLFVLLYHKYTKLFGLHMLNPQYFA